MRNDQRPGQAARDGEATVWRSNARTPVVSGLLLSLASGGLLALVVVNSLQGNLNPGVGPLIGAVGLSAILAVVLVASVRRTIERAGERITVDADGIHYTTLRGTTDLAWADIDAVRIRVGFTNVASNRRFAPRVLQRIPRPVLEVVYRGAISEQQARVLRGVTLPHPAPDGFTHSFAVVEVHVTAGIDPVGFATGLQELLPRIAPGTYLGTTVDPD
jgi:hypothetical protein